MSSAVSAAVEEFLAHTAKSATVLKVDERPVHTS